MRTVGGCTLDWLTSGTEIETDANRKKESVLRMSAHRMSVRTV